MQWRINKWKQKLTQLSKKFTWKIGKYNQVVFAFRVEPNEANQHFDEAVREL